MFVTVTAAHCGFDPAVARPVTQLAVPPTAAGAGCGPESGCSGADRRERWQVNATSQESFLGLDEGNSVGYSQEMFSAQVGVRGQITGSSFRCYER